MLTVVITTLKTCGNVENKSFSDSEQLFSY